jgi:23S rRNA-/tRNA-specific pseudouridylate synthase
MHLLGINFFIYVPFFLLEHAQVLLDEGKAERVILAHPSGVDGAQDALTEYRVLGPTINGCSWLELRPLTGRKHQIP